MVQWILTHGDTDGICSGAIVLAAFKDAKVYFSHPKDLAEDLRQVNGDVIICDIAIPAGGLEEALGELRRLRGAGGNIIYIDHHPLPAGFIAADFPGECVHSLNACGAELTFIRFQDMVPPDLNRVAIYGAIGDTLDRTYNVERFLRGWDKSHLYLESGILAQAVDSIGRNYDMKRELVSFLAGNRIPSSDERLVFRAVSQSINDEANRSRIKSVVKVFGNVAYVLDNDWSMGKSALYSMAETHKLVGVGAETRKGLVEMSLRTYMESLDLNMVLTDITARLGGSGGGHPKAAGARVPADKFQLFLEMLDRSVVENVGIIAVEY